MNFGIMIIVTRRKSEQGKTEKMRRGKIFRVSFCIRTFRKREGGAIFVRILTKAEFNV